MSYRDAGISGARGREGTGSRTWSAACAPLRRSCRVSKSAAAQSRNDG